MANEPIFARARAGLLAAIADKVLVNGEDVGREVPGRLWPDFGMTHHNIDWVRGDFHTSSGNEMFNDYKAFGVRFDRADAVRMGADFERQSTPIPGLRGIATEPKWNWEEPLIELIAIAERDNLVDTFALSQRGGQAKLEKWFADWFVAKHGISPGESECRKRAKAIKESLPSV